MASVNKVFLLGNAGKDAEVRYAPSGMAIASVSLATTSRRKDKTSGDVIEDTQWHRLVFYDRLAEIAGEYVKKGKPIFVEGRLKYGKYTDKDGVDRYTTDIVVFELQLLGSRDDGGEPQQRQAPASRAPASRPQQPAAAPRKAAAPDDGWPDDDIPFALNLNAYSVASSKDRRMSRCNFK